MQIFPGRAPASVMIAAATSRRSYRRTRLGEDPNLLFSDRPVRRVRGDRCTRESLRAARGLQHAALGLGDFVQGGAGLDNTGFHPSPIHPLH